MAVVFIPMALASLIVSIGALGAVVIVGLVQTGRLTVQANRIRESWQAQNAFEIARDIQSDRQRDARREIYGLKSRERPYSEWTARQRNQADVVLQQLNTAAYLAERDLLPAGMLEENWGNVFRNVYEAAKPRMEARRDRWARELWLPFERLAIRLLDEEGAEPFYPPEDDDVGESGDVPTSLSDLSREIARLVNQLSSMQ